MNQEMMLDIKDLDKKMRVVQKDILKMSEI
jgi:hypothetical protein